MSNPGKGSKRTAQDAGLSDDQIVKKQKTIVVKGKAPVDEYFPSKQQVHVYVDGETIYDCMMNQTKTGRNNNNKFYVVQLLESDAGGRYVVWCRWFDFPPCTFSLFQIYLSRGRNGTKGQTSAKEFGTNLCGAKSEYENKVFSKSQKGEYEIIARDFGEEKKDAADIPTNPSALPVATQNLMSLIFSNSLLQQTLKELKYDANKMPLGRLCRAQIEKGYSILKEISAIVKPQDTTSSSTIISEQDRLTELSNAYYSRIPHIAPSTREKLPVIETSEQVDREIELLNSLIDAKELQRITDQSHEQGSTQNLLDRNYEGLNCALRPLEPEKSQDDKQVFDIVNTYLKRTHASTHNYSLQLMDVFEVDRRSERERFEKKAQQILTEFDEKQALPARQLLWHGSRVTNFVGILSQGLRIAPPEAPVTGYMFGKGVYFANMSSKSANYCNAGRDNNTAIMLLCEVLTGNVRPLKHSDYYASELPAGKHSTQGLGKTAPDPASSCFMPKDGSLFVPLGHPKRTNIPDASLLYDEFIVYSVDQIRMKYLVKVRFDYD